MEFHAFIRNRLDMLRSEGRFRTLPDIGERSGKFIYVAGQSRLNLSSNDYLGLAEDRFLRDAYSEACREQGYSMTSSSSRLLTGNHHWYEQLERELEQMYGRDAALVFNSGYHANVGILPALAGRNDLILSDRLNHASIIDGAGISGAVHLRYRHNDTSHLEELLDSAQGSYRHRFIVTESVFSMDGDLADLRKLVQLKKRYGAVLIVDEAHAAGVFGERGLGLCETTGTVADMDIIIGTFGKAFASTGAYAVMDSVIRDYLVNTMRSFIFTTALPPAVLAWSMMTLRKQSEMYGERIHLQRIAAMLRGRLADAGFEVSGVSQIVPVITGSNESAVILAEKLRRAGVLGMAVRPPTVPENRARIRLSLRANLQWDDIEYIPDLIKAGRS
ncbi:MAG: 8-amino-7-oxononanoate synthase [Chlorobium sp.]|jgi:8-amino-7-oxononanoate synthase|uniref:aminotransferase class I/II-fold pyridoxal phosphate-dependent enzyme n=1 Tax=Chlorobium sp. TaxID=1095 RepID=UPI001D351B35|nr:8-amino-7-oxononanoate synthase [Chlorobium sp.]MBN1278517.1 8-amino-7-oxononanoate synthase [Chlorobiaceae bacterium]MCF8215577.1 8-amino-7-oxononanoate synthase [Chlorobium sp.]MCF8270369.1 8-amino-7-oxononanoate synthase [Chlorobium sp.]MCF8286738.1 8-amino-7-oxononanoate synthase [Chlorobium sp.]MCF8290260.1 8-amino-7-oxononanoate synthase [Chlorobium sp.]